jgi:hypothetical protein
MTSRWNCIGMKSQQAWIDAVAMGVDRPYLRALRVAGIDEHIPSRGYDRRRDTQQGGIPGLQPSVSCAAGGGFVTPPLAAESMHIHGLHRDRIERLDFQILKRVRKVPGLDLNMDQYFH